MLIFVFKIYHNISNKFVLYCIEIYNVPVKDIINNVKDYDSSLQEGLCNLRLYNCYQIYI